MSKDPELLDVFYAIFTFGQVRPPRHLQVGGPIKSELSSPTMLSTASVWTYTHTHHSCVKVDWRGVNLRIGIISYWLSKPQLLP